MLVNEQETRPFLGAVGMGDVALEAVFLFFQAACNDSGHTQLPFKIYEPPLNR
jgi:hypothetical protein